MAIRFEVQERGVTDTYFAVIDMSHEEYNMPEEAVTIFFHSRTAAQAVCDLLNVEWNHFLVQVGRSSL